MRGVFMALTNNNYPNLGKNIRGLRKAFGETQLDLALSIRASGPNVISQYESGERMPERDYLLRIAKHYRITENELLHGNFENMRVLTKFPVGDSDFGMTMLAKMFPLICTPKALENSKFKEAYTIHTRLINELKEGENFEEEKIEQCLEIYKEASRNGLDEATANHLWWLMFLGFLTVFFTPRLIETLDVADINGITSKDVFGGILPSFDEADSEREFDTNQDRLEFLEKCEIDLVVDIALLRKSKEYSDLGDYYLALRHKFSLLRNTLSAEMNSAVGDELLLTFSLMGNKYCDNFMTASKPT